MEYVTSSIGNDTNTNQRADIIWMLSEENRESIYLATNET